MSKTVNLRVTPSVQVNASTDARIKTYVNLALHHLFAACRFAAHLRKLEREHKSEPYGPFWDEILHNALGVATLAVASLEGYANELYFQSTGALAPALNPAATEVISQLADKEKILLKYDLVLTLRSGNRLCYDSTLVQNVDALIRLRNSIVHFRPRSM